VPKEEELHTGRCCDQMSSSKFSPTSSVRERRSISIIISKLLTGRRKKKIAQGLL
jgi:hypothetical protein